MKKIDELINYLNECEDELDLTGDLEVVVTSLFRRSIVKKDEKIIILSHIIEKIVTD